MKKILFPLGVIIIILAISCAKLQQPTQPGGLQTPTLTRTITPVCSATFSNTITGTHTNTPVCSATPSKTITVTRTSTPVPAATATCTATVDVVNIYVILQYEDNSGLLLEQYAVTAADSAGVTLTTAAVSLIGPAGIIGLPSANGVMTYSTLGSAPNYQFSAQYAVSVTYNAVNYYGTFTSNPDITIAADGSQVSWPYAADSAMIVLYTPYACMTMQMYGPYLTSPFDVNATGIYAHCAGDYQIAPVITDTAPITFGQTGVTGTAVMQILKMAVITKP